MYVNVSGMRLGVPVTFVSYLMKGEIHFPSILQIIAQVKAASEGKETTEVTTTEKMGCTIL